MTQSISQEEANVVKDNGILEFMSADRAIELYTEIHASGIPKLDWQFYGRKEQREPDIEDPNKEAKNENEPNTAEPSGQNELINTEFDFDEEFNDLQLDTLIFNESLSLKNRPELGSDKKTNLSDIMSDILKESHND